MLAPAQPVRRPDERGRLIKRVQNAKGDVSANQRQAACLQCPAAGIEELLHGGAGQGDLLQLLDQGRHRG